MMSVLGAPVISAMTSRASARAVDQVVIQGDAAHRGVRVAVGDREHGPLVLHGPFQEAAARRQVHHVVLVDPRRAGQHRHRADVGRLRRVLDQLHQLVPEHHLARGRGEVLADGERPGVDLARQAAVVEQVIDEMAGPGSHAGPAGLQRPLERGRVRGQEIRRRDRIEQETGRERGLSVIDRVPGPGRQHVGHQPGRGQVRLADGEERRVGRPRRVGEPLIPSWHRNRRRRVHAQPASRGHRSGDREAGPVAQRRGPRRPRLPRGTPQHRQRRRAQPRRIRRGEQIGLGTQH